MPLPRFPRRVPSLESQWIYRAYKLGVILGLVAYLGFWVWRAHENGLEWLLDDVLDHPGYFALAFIFGAAIFVVFPGAILFVIVYIIEAVVKSVAATFDPRLKALARNARQMKFDQSRTSGSRSAESLENSEVKPESLTRLPEPGISHQPKSESQ
jgi:hypothetical protein